MSQELRQRNKQGEGDSSYLDEDEQEEIVKSLADEATYQIERSNKSAAAIGCLVAALTVVMIILNPFVKMTSMLWIHSIISSGLHLYATMNHAKDMTKENRHDVFMVASGFLSSFPLAVTEKDALMFDLHLAIFIGNVLTASVAVWLRRDSFETLRAIQVLDQARYKYKSL
jgi:hypothetical protein